MCSKKQARLLYWWVMLQATLCVLIALNIVCTASDRSLIRGFGFTDEATNVVLNLLVYAGKRHSSN